MKLTDICVVSVHSKLLVYISIDCKITLTALLIKNLTLILMLKVTCPSLVSVKLHVSRASSLLYT